jgi:hypothetical protein
MSRMSTLHLELQDMAEYWIGRDDAKRGARRATTDMKPKARQAYDLGRSEWIAEHRPGWAL